MAPARRVYNPSARSGCAPPRGPAGLRSRTMNPTIRGSAFRAALVLAAAAVLASVPGPGGSPISGEEGGGGGGAAGAGADPQSFYPEATAEQKTAVLASINRLASDDWRTRCLATAELVEAGDAAIPFMARALEAAADPDAAFRLRFALDALEWVPDSTMRWLVGEGVGILVNPPRRSAELDEVQGNLALLKRRTKERLVRQGRRLLPAVVSLLESPDYNRRRLAVEILSDICMEHGDKRAIPALLRALEDPSDDSYVEIMAAEGLARITGLAFKSYQVKEWREWWKANSETYSVPARRGSRPTRTR